MKTRLPRLCLNKTFHHMGEIHSKGICKTCYAYSYAHQGKPRPASLIIADIERKGEDPFSFSNKAEELAQYLATCRSEFELSALIAEARLWYSEKDPEYKYDQEHTTLIEKLDLGEVK